MFDIQGLRTNLATQPSSVTLRVVLPPRNELHRRPIEGTARFLTFSTYRRLRLFNNDAIKDHFVRYLSEAVKAHEAQLIAWVVMPDHVHLIIFFEGEDRVPAFLQTLKRPFARSVLHRWRQLEASVLDRLRATDGENRFWQPGGGFDRNVIGQELVEKIIYIHKNPITRGLSADGSSWKWSSARAYEHRADAVGPELAFHLVPHHKGSLT